jgi:hypothetical protein
VMTCFAPTILASFGRSGWELGEARTARRIAFT